MMVRLVSNLFKRCGQLVNSFLISSCGGAQAPRSLTCTRAMVLYEPTMANGVSLRRSRDKFKSRHTSVLEQDGK